MFDNSIAQRVAILIETGNGTSDLAALKAEAASLALQLQGVVVGGRLAGKTMEQIGDDSRELSARLVELNRMTAEYERQMAGVGRGAQAASRGFLEFSRAVEDLTVAGPLGALNNIPGIMTSIGQAAGLSATSVAVLTAGTSLLATAAFVVWKNWDLLEEKFKLGIERPAIQGIEGIKDALEKAKKEVEGFEKQTRLSLGEFDAYDKAKEKVAGLNAELQKRKDLEDLLSGQSKGERERASGFKEAVAENRAGGGDPLNSLITALQGDMDAKGNVIDPTTNRAATPRAAAENLLRNAGQGEKQARSQILGILRGAYGENDSFSANIVAASPEEKERKKALAERLEMVLKEDEAAMKALQEKGQERAKAQAKASEDAKKEEERNLRNQQQMGREKEAAAKKAEADAERAQRERDTAARQFTPAFEGAIQAEIAANQFKANAGAPVARNARDLQRLRGMGIDAAVPEAALQQDLMNRIATDMERGGVKDPTLAREVVMQAMGKMTTQAAKLSAMQATGMSGLADNQALIAVQWEQAQGAQANANAKILGVNGQLRRQGQRRPPALRRGR